jgi:sn-glycerol 3-phosphate transport system permease protein
VTTDAGAEVVAAPEELLAEAPVVKKGPARSRAAQRRREAMLGYLLVLPAFVVFAVFTFYPFGKNFQLALYRSPPFPNLPKRYVGLEQVGDVLGSEDFRQSLWATVAFALMSVPVGIFLGLALAVAAHRRLRGIGIYRTIFASTVTSSVAVASVIFGTLFNPRIGYLPWMGFDPQPPLLENPDWVLPSVALVSVWQNTGLSFIVMTAGLQTLPDEVLEAAEIDGARAWRRFWRVTVPMLSPTIFFAVVVGSIFAFQAFGQIDLLAPNGGPLQRANVLVYFIYSKRQDPGYAAVLAIALFVITLMLTLFQLRVLERRVHYAT